MKYIDTDKLKAEIKNRINELEHDKYLSVDSKTVRIAELHFIDRSIDSLQQEPIPDTDVLHTKLVNLLKAYRIDEETARTMADRIANTYGVQRYMDGLCDGMDKRR